MSLQSTAWIACVRQGHSSESPLRVQTGSEITKMATNALKPTQWLKAEVMRMNLDQGACSCLMP